jgi:hypothetical protein
MAKKDILIAAEGRTVHQADGALWPKDGLEDPGTLFTRRRLKDGDLIAKSTAAAKKASAGSEGDK